MTGIHFLDARGPDGMRIHAIGDVHGRLDLLRQMHESIAAELVAHPVEDWRIIHLGDYVDRGPDSRGVLDFLIAARERDPRHIMLAGNHDVGFLDFLAAPSAESLFARFGGVDTARSYGVDARFAPPEALEKDWGRLLRAVPNRHQEFLRAMEFSVSFGDFYFCHAGIRPRIALDRQMPEDLIWVRDVFLNHPELHEKVIVHGHTPDAEPEVMPNRVNVDTGAFRTGVLTALVIEGGEKQILQVRA
jgi:serine/threonine protein phosphatase 1